MFHHCFGYENCLGNSPLIHLRSKSQSNFFESRLRDFLTVLSRLPIFSLSILPRWKITVGIQREAFLVIWLLVASQRYFQSYVPRWQISSCLFLQLAWNLTHAKPILLLTHTPSSNFTSSSCLSSSLSRRCSGWFLWGKVEFCSDRGWSGVSVRAVCCSGRGWACLMSAILWMRVTPARSAFGNGAYCRWSCP